MKLLVLYEELAPYFLTNIQYFADYYKIPVLIIAKSPNPVAPFKFQTHSPFIEIIYREKYTTQDIINKIKVFEPTVLMQAGWIFPPYFKIVQHLKLPQNILLLDNQWENTFRQNIGSFYFRFKYKHLFQKAFVPGYKQKEFAKHLGFADKDIELGFYCCDTKMFESIYFKRKDERKRNYTFLYIGRYAPEKNIELLWEAFIEVCKEIPNQWKLICAGKGNIPPVQHPQIVHLGFLQPTELLNVLSQADVFVLPSKFEPWGVVIHEVTTAGLPVISSLKTGANEFFVEHQKNGFIFNPNNKNELKKYLIKMTELSDNEYFNMCEHSYKLSQKITTHTWIQKIYHLCRI